MTVAIKIDFASQLACEVYSVVVHTRHLPALQTNKRQITIDVTEVKR